MSEADRVFSENITGFCFLVIISVYVVAGIAGFIISI